jgi:hypothetical protein
MFKWPILPKVSSKGNERHLKVKIRFCIVLFLSVVYHNGTEPSSLWDTTEQILFRCVIQWKKISCFLGYKGRKVVKHSETVSVVVHKGGRPLPIPQQKKVSVVGYNGGNLLCCKIQQRKTYTAVSHNARMLLRCNPQRQSILLQSI